MEIRLDKLSIVETNVDKILQNKSRYQKVVESSQIPWYFVGIINSMESGQNFSTHLHNGDPLTKRTTHVPSGRPKTGNPSLYLGRKRRRRTKTSRSGSS